jgi:biopolymer transport protein ExbD
MSSIGAPFNQLKTFLGPNHKELTQKQPGIPTDSVANSPKNELDYWVKFSRQAAPAAFIAVRGDRNAKFGTFNSVVKTLVRNRANRFALITNMQTESNQ